MSTVVYLSSASSYTQALDLMATASAALAQYRMALGLSAADQAKAIGISTDSLSKLGPSSNVATLTKALIWLAAQ